MRESTSRNQANGSMPDRLQEAMKLRNTAAVGRHRRCRRMSSCRGYVRLYITAVMYRRGLCAVRKFEASHQLVGSNGELHIIS